MGYLNELLSKNPLIIDGDKIRPHHKYTDDLYIGSDNACRFGLLGEVLDLINHLQADKEALIAGQETLQKCIAEKMAEIERLQEQNKMIEGASIIFNGGVKYVRAEAIKEFAKELENCFCVSKEYLEITSIIDNLVKEMVGDSE